MVVNKGTFVSQIVASIENYRQLSIKEGKTYCNSSIVSSDYSSIEEYFQLWTRLYFSSEFSVKTLFNYLLDTCSFAFVELLSDSILGIF